MAMNNSSRLYQLIKPMVVSSSLGDVFHGLVLRQYHRIPLAKGVEGRQRIMSLISFWKTNKSVCEMTPPRILSTSKLSTYEILEPGMILMKDYVGLKDQVDIVNICEKWGMGPGGFYKPAELQSYMMCFGRNWDPETGYKNRYRSDGSEAPPLPHELISLAESAVQDAQTLLVELPSMRPDNCLVNFYPLNGLWELHQDRDESPDSLGRGLPVVSISIGESVTFEYGDTRDEKKSKYVLLNSGDVLIFGGKSRLIYHGVAEVGQYTVPLPLIDETGFHGGHLSLNLRQSVCSNLG